MKPFKNLTRHLNIHYFEIFQPKRKRYKDMKCRVQGTLELLKVEAYHSMRDFSCSLLNFSVSQCHKWSRNSKLKSQIRNAAWRRFFKSFSSKSFHIWTRLNLKVFLRIPSVLFTLVYKWFWFTFHLPMFSNISYNNYIRLNN